VNSKLRHPCNLGYFFKLNQQSFFAVYYLELKLSISVNLMVIRFNNASF